jgi:hypothetical protein
MEVPLLTRKSLSSENQKSAILGGIAGAKHIHTLAEAYGATVIFIQTTVLKTFTLGRWFIRCKRRALQSLWQISFLFSHARFI